METLLEQQRRLHEERERLENSMADEMLHKKQSVRSTLTLFSFVSYDRRAIMVCKLIPILFFGLNWLM